MAPVQESSKFLALAAGALSFPAPLQTPLIVLALCQAGLLLEALFKVETRDDKAQAKLKDISGNDDVAAKVPSTFLSLEKCLSFATWIMPASSLTTAAFMIVFAQLYVLMLQKSEIPFLGNLTSVGAGFFIRAAAAFALVSMLECYLKQCQAAGVEKACEEDEAAGTVCACGCGTNSDEGCPYSEDFWSDSTLMAS
eukprot:TRINITY_DN50050_c0_g1_i1.p1 TRINITY_DN50050_c0_g1~~TRINITY_DN50050_c0_g1_i1.p1  ORF type:complete len:196 (+),score=50.42 TRINITY_DN50050_c0_g1_i1:163-750(+)